MSKKNVISCFCLAENGRMHCPLTNDKSDLEQTFNYQVRGEEILRVDIDASFVCEDERKDYCKNCPFK